MGNQSSTSEGAVGVMLCCTSPTASAALSMEPGLRQLDPRATIIVSDEPAPLRAFLCKESRPSVIVVLKSPATSHTVISGLVREFALRRGANQRLLIREWKGEDAEASALLEAVRSAAVSLRQRLARAASAPSSKRFIVGSPRSWALESEEAFRVGESTDSWVVPAKLGAPRQWRMWFGFVVAMVLTVAVVLSFHHVRVRGDRTRSEAPQDAEGMPTAALEVADVRTVASSDGAPGFDAIEALVRGGDARVLDLSMIHAPDLGPDVAGRSRVSSGIEAERYCGDLHLGPFAHWYLPTAAELASFQTARLLPPGRYWVLGSGTGEPEIATLSDREYRQRVPARADVGVVCIRVLSGRP